MKHKMNKDWQHAADEVKSVVHNAGEEDVAGIQHMYDAIADAGTDPKARALAALGAFADNTRKLQDAASADSGTSAEEVVSMAKSLLSFTLKHFDSNIAHSVLHGHKKD